MAEPRYTLSREALSLRNRHMVKCYPSFWEREAKVEEFWRRFEFYKGLAEKQGKLVEFLGEFYEKDKEKETEKFQVSPEIRPLTRAGVTNKRFDLSKVPMMDSESWLRRSVPDSDRFEYGRRKSEKEMRFGSLHESTLYIDHFCLGGVKEEEF